MWNTLHEYQVVVSDEPDEWDTLSRKDRLVRLESARSQLKRGEDYFTC